jgi:Fic family protein
MMVDATRHAGTPLTRERLFGWHAALFPTGRSGMRRISVGAWRTRESGPLQVVSGPIGRERVHFEAPATERLDGEMTAFLEWFERPSSLDPVLKAGVAHFWFVTVHPFEDGNGRIARAIADMALARSEGLRDRFYSMSAQIERERDAYYLQLELCQRGALDITAWLDWFLGCLGRAIDGTDEALAAVLGKARHSGYRLLPGAGALVTLRATQSAPSTITMIPAATACERPTGVVPGIAVVAIAAA